MIREPTINNPKIIPPIRLSKEHKALAVAETLSTVIVITSDEFLLIYVRYGWKRLFLKILLLNSISRFAVNLIMYLTLKSLKNVLSETNMQNKIVINNKD